MFSTFKAYNCRIKAELAENVSQDFFGVSQADLMLDGFAAVKGVAGAIEAEALRGHGNGAITLAHGDRELQDTQRVSPRKMVKST